MYWEEDIKKTAHPIHFGVINYVYCGMRFRSLLKNLKEKIDNGASVNGLDEMGLTPLNHCIRTYPNNSGSKLCLS